MKVAFPRFESRRSMRQSPSIVATSWLHLVTSGEAPQMARALPIVDVKHSLASALRQQLTTWGRMLLSAIRKCSTASRASSCGAATTSQLIRWICRTDVQLTSRLANRIRSTIQSIGELPVQPGLWKPMTVEQLFILLLIATGAREAFGSDWNSVEKRQAGCSSCRWPEHGRERRSRSVRRDDSRRH